MRRSAVSAVLLFVGTRCGTPGEGGGVGGEE